jgi:hypothetical protein
MQRIGVFVCWCGTNIAGTVDVVKVADALKSEPGVVFSANYQYMCSQAGQDMIVEAVKEHNLTGIVVCSCSPRMHEATFRKTAEKAGINPYMVEIANIREQCSWIHKDMAEGTEKAIILGKAAVAKVNLNAPLTPGETPVTKRALVIGGGIAGEQRQMPAERIVHRIGKSGRRHFPLLVHLAHEFKRNPNLAPARSENDRHLLTLRIYLPRDRKRSFFNRRKPPPFHGRNELYIRLGIFGGRLPLGAGKYFHETFSNRQTA